MQKWKRFCRSWVGIFRLVKGGISVVRTDNDRFSIACQIQLFKRIVHSFLCVTAFFLSRRHPKQYMPWTKGWASDVYRCWKAHTVLVGWLGWEQRTGRFLDVPHSKCTVALHLRRYDYRREFKSWNPLFRVEPLGKYSVKTAEVRLIIRLIILLIFFFAGRTNSSVLPQSLHWYQTKRYVCLRKISRCNVKRTNTNEGL